MKVYLTWYPFRIPFLNGPNSGGCGKRVATYTRLGRALEADMIARFIKAEVNPEAKLYLNTPLPADLGNNTYGLPLELVGTDGCPSWGDFELLLVVDFTQYVGGGRIIDPGPLADALREREVSGRLRIVNLMVDRDNFCQIANLKMRVEARKGGIREAKMMRKRLGSSLSDDLDLLEQRWIPDELWAPVVNISAYREFLLQRRVIGTMGWRQVPTEDTLRIPSWKAIDLFKYFPLKSLPQESQNPRSNGTPTLLFYGIPRYSWRKQRVRSIFQRSHEEGTSTVAIGYEMKSLQRNPLHTFIPAVPFDQLQDTIFRESGVELLLTGDEDFAAAGSLILRAHETFNFGLPVAIDSVADPKHLLGDHLGQLYPETPWRYI